jgi:K(+)-stimulated pyrophosphate-energized sodium pump
VAISTDASIKKMMLPGAIAIISPIIIGFILGPEALGGFLAGATVSGVLMGMFQNNAGGAWDNAKKSFEKGVEINGETYFKKSEPHKASVTGDTVGDPFKDTSGPSMNILIKLMSIVSLVLAPTLAQFHKDSAEATSKMTSKNIEVRVSQIDTSSAADKKNLDIEIRNGNGEVIMKEFIDQLQKDHLDENGNLGIEWKNDILTINGKVQPKEVAEKYSTYLEKGKTFSISISTKK